MLLRLNLKIAVNYAWGCGSYSRSVCNLSRRFVKKAPVILAKVQEGTPVVSCAINVPRQQLHQSYEVSSQMRILMGLCLWGTCAKFRARRLQTLGAAAQYQIDQGRDFVFVFVFRGSIAGTASLIDPILRNRGSSKRGKGLTSFKRKGIPLTNLHSEGASFTYMPMLSAGSQL